MNLHRTTLPILASLLCTLLLAGCGEPSKKDYEKEMTAIGEKADKDMKQLEGGQPTEKDIKEAGDTLEQVADDFEDVTPPSEVEDLHDDLVKTVRDLAGSMDQMDEMIKDPANADPKDMEKLQKASERLDKITKGYKKKGYDIGIDE